jgi:NAD+ kinase
VSALPELTDAPCDAGRVPVSAIGLVIHGGKPEAQQVADVVRSWAARNDVHCADVDVWSDGVQRLEDELEAARAGSPDLIVTIGGDGTFLRGVRIAAVLDAQILGVNVGRVGFLAEVPTEGVLSALDAVHEGRSRVETRMTLTMRASRPLEVPSDLESFLQYGRGPALPPPHTQALSPRDIGWGVRINVAALNDVVFEKLARDRQASLAVYVMGRHFASYSSDALIVSTPTGSTAYNFAAGGPILSPHMDALVFTPVAPHMVFDRSIVLAGDERIGVRVLDRSGAVTVSVDGQLRGVLQPGDWVSVYASEYRPRLVRLLDTDFLGRLRSRFHLADADAALADGDVPPVYDPGTPPPSDMAHPGRPPSARDR